MVPGYPRSGSRAKGPDAWLLLGLDGSGMTMTTHASMASHTHGMAIEDSMLGQTIACATMTEVPLNVAAGLP